MKKREEPLKSICPICNREMPDDRVYVDEHHLIPKSKGGRDKILLHKICHQKIHSLWTEKELSKYYNNVDSIKNDYNMKKFIGWVKNKPPTFLLKTKDSRIRKRKRKR